MWKLRAKFFPIIDGALGKINKGLVKNVQLLLRQSSAAGLRNNEHCKHQP
jgi:hypothetical protein